MMRIFRRRPGFVVFKLRAYRAMIFAVTAALILLLAVWIGIVRVKPTVIALARAQAREYVLMTISDSVKTEMESGRMQYKEIVTLERDNKGDVTALITDSMKINSLQSQIAGKIAENIANIQEMDMAIHFGDIFGGYLLRGRGPLLPIRVQSVTDVTASIINDFSDAGINQTRHKISLIVSVNIEILIPAGQTQVSVATEIAIAETIIVGNVPQVYARAG